MKNTIGIFLIFLFLKLSAESAYVIVPCTDLVGTSLESKEEYLHLPCSFAKNKPPRYFYRIHQLLFLNKVEILGKTDTEYLIKTHESFYQSPTCSQFQNYYWGLKDHFVLESSLKKGVLSYLPAAFNLRKNIDELLKNNCFLLFPWKDLDGTIYSAGTRFVRNEKNDDEHNYSVHSLKNGKIVKKSIPKKLCTLPPINTSNQNKINNFISILRQWTKNSQKIAYVTGGCSFINNYNPQEVIEKEKFGGVVYDRKTSNIQRDGFDCSSLILKAAQMSAIPYYFKNTATLARYLKPLEKDDVIENGDFIWIPGHVLVISNKNKNMVIEARGYDHGYGIVHEIKLDKVFKDMHSINDLKQAFLMKKPLQRLNKQQKVADAFSNWKILKLSSIWNIKNYSK